MKGRSFGAHGSNPFCDEGALGQCAHLQTEVDDCESALQRENIRRTRAGRSRGKDARIRDGLLF